MKNFNYIIDGIIAPRNEEHCRHLTFTALLPSQTVEPLWLETPEQSVDAMMRCKSQFDLQILSHGIYASRS